MSAHSQLTVTALENQAFALMGRLHVILRRENGRITDIEYMRSNADYCRHVLDLAAAAQNEDLQQICGKLRAIYFGEEGLFVRAQPKPPLLARLHVQDEPAAPAPVELPTTRHEPPAPAGNQAYVGRLR